MKKQSLLILIAILSITACQVKPEYKLELQRELKDPFIHTAYFWFKATASEAEKQSFISDAEKLKDISTVKAFYSGKPANTNRSVVENSYDYAIVFHFEDLEAQEVYQNDPLHVGMIEKHAAIWERVMVTDID